jgi:hypothetical protein
VQKSNETTNDVYKCITFSVGELVGFAVVGGEVGGGVACVVVVVVVVVWVVVVVVVVTTGLTEGDWDGLDVGLDVGLFVITVAVSICTSIPRTVPADASNSSEFKVFVIPSETFVSLDDISYSTSREYRRSERCLRADVSRRAMIWLSTTQRTVTPVTASSTFAQNAFCSSPVRSLGSDKKKVCFS